MTKFLFVLLSALPSAVIAQHVGIGTTAPDELLHVDSIIHIGKNQVIQAGSTRKNLVRFGDDNYVTIGEQDKDDRMVLKAASFSFNTGSVGIGVDSAREKLDVAGGIKLGFASGVNPGTVRFNTAVNDIEYRDNIAWTGIKNKYQSFNSYFFESALTNVEVNVPQTDITVTESGTYLINYFVDAYNTFTQGGSTSAEIQDKLVFYTYVYLDNKTTSARYQQQKIDFLDANRDYSGSAYFTYFQLPAHQVTGVTVQQLNAGEKIGLKMQQTAETLGQGKMRINLCNITLVKLY